MINNKKNIWDTHSDCHKSWMPGKEEDALGEAHVDHISREDKQKAMYHNIHHNLRPGCRCLLLLPICVHFSDPTDVCNRYSSLSTGYLTWLGVGSASSQRGEFS